MPEPQKHKLTLRQQRMLSEYKQRQNQDSDIISESMELAEVTIDSVESLYEALLEDGTSKNQASLMISLRSWVTEVSEFDPVSGHALHTGIIDFLEVIAQNINSDSDDKEIKDRVYRIVNHVAEAIRAITENMRTKIMRDHALMPIYAAREIDSKSIQWLSRKPGRTLREKLSGKPYIRAVRRRSCMDSSENRLLKALVLRLEQIFIRRKTTGYKRK